MVEQAVCPEAFPVVGDDHDHRVVGQAFELERREQAGDVVIREGDLSLVERLGGVRTEVFAEAGLGLVLEVRIEVVRPEEPGAGVRRGRLL